MLIGQSADEETVKAISELLDSRPEIDKVLNLITFQLGSQVMVAIKAKMKKAESFDQVVKNINTCESELKRAIPSVRWVFFEPDNKA